MSYSTRCCCGRTQRKKLQLSLLNNLMTPSPPTPPASQPVSPTRHPSHFPTANKSQLWMWSRRQREDWIYSAIWESTERRPQGSSSSSDDKEGKENAIKSRRNKNRRERGGNCPRFRKASHKVAPFHETFEKGSVRRSSLLLLFSPLVHFQGLPPLRPRPSFLQPTPVRSVCSARTTLRRAVVIRLIPSISRVSVT